MPDRTYFIYIMTNQHDQVLYTGVTNDLFRRVSEHKEWKGGKFTSRYHLTKLVYYEVFDYINDALEREKQIKGGSRKKKIEMISEMNPEWIDLFEDLQFWDCFVRLRLPRNDKSWVNRIEMFVIASAATQSQKWLKAKILQSQNYYIDFIIIGVLF